MISRKTTKVIRRKVRWTPCIFF